MFNFGNRKTTGMFSKIIIGILVLAMVLSAVVPFL